jgi:predicted nucleotidyltransferase
MEKDLSQFVGRLARAAGDNLLSVVLYGSAARQEFDTEFSDVNLLCVVRELASAELAGIAPAVAGWVHSGYPAPLIFSHHELERSTDVFAIEMLDIQQHHRVLYGEDVFRNLHVPMERHRAELEHELRTKLLLLRQHYLLVPADNKKLAALMLDSVSNFATLFRHTLLTLGGLPPRAKPEVILELARRLRFDPRPFLDLLAVRDHSLESKTLDVQATFAGYLRGIEKVVAAVDDL